MTEKKLSEREIKGMKKATVRNVGEESFQPAFKLRGCLHYRIRRLSDSYHWRHRRVQTARKQALSEVPLKNTGVIAEAGNRGGADWRFCI